MSNPFPRGSGFASKNSYTQNSFAGESAFVEFTQRTPAQAPVESTPPKSFQDQVKMDSPSTLFYMSQIAGNIAGKPVKSPCAVPSSVSSSLRSTNEKDKQLSLFEQLQGISMRSWKQKGNGMRENEPEESGQDAGPEQTGENAAATGTEVPIPKIPVVSPQLKNKIMQTPCSQAGRQLSTLFQMVNPKISSSVSLIGQNHGKLASAKAPAPITGGCGSIGKAD